MLHGESCDNDDAWDFSHVLVKFSSRKLEPRMRARLFNNRFSLFQENTCSLRVVCFQHEEECLSLGFLCSSIDGIMT